MSAIDSRRSSLFSVVIAGTLFAAVSPAVAQEINLYTYREPALIKPLLDEFTKETGIKVNTIFAASGLEERLRAEGQNSPADCASHGRHRPPAAGEGVRRHPAREVRPRSRRRSLPPIAIPEGNWFGVSLRGRVVYASKDRVKQDSITYEELADPKWKGKFCVRSGQHLYNISLFAAMIAQDGEAKAEEWLKGLKANLAKKPSGGDREQAKDILAGACDVALGNTYYVGLMRHASNEQRQWGEAIKVIMPTFKDGGGTHVNVSGLSLMKNAPNRQNALKFMEFMVSDEAQKIHADVNFEYPVKAGIQLDETVASFGQLNPDALPIAEIAKHRKAASQLVDKVGFDQ